MSSTSFSRTDGLIQRILDERHSRPTTQGRNPKLNATLGEREYDIEVGILEGEKPQEN